MAKLPMIKILFGADTRQLGKAMRDTERHTKTWRERLSDGFTRVGNAMKYAAAAAVGLAAVMVKDGVRAAIEDAKSQRILAKQLQNTLGASDKLTKSTEDFIDATQRAYGVVDDELRPALARLIRSTKDTSKAKHLLKTALNVSAATGKDLNTVVMALSKGYDGNVASLGRLGLGIDRATLKTGKFNDIWKMLDSQFKGFAEERANSVEGKFERVKIAIDEAEESIGYAMLPALTDLADWANSPEGQKVIEDFAASFSEAMKAAAEVMPGLVEDVGNLADKASGIDWEEILGGAKFAAAAAIGMKVPGPWQVKLFAAAAAYFGIDFMTDEEGITRRQRDVSVALNDAISGKGLTRGGGSPMWNAPVTINVNGAVDPKGTANQINRLLTRGSLNGSNPMAGKGIG